MELESTTPLYRFLNHPVMLVLMQVFAPLVTFGLLMLFFWLDAGAISSASVVVLSILGNVEILIAGVGLWALLSPLKRTRLMWGVATLNALAMTTLIALLMYTNDTLSAELPIWLGADIPILFLVFMGHLLMLQCAVGALCTRPSAFFKDLGADVGASVIWILFLIGAAFLLINVASPFQDAFHVWAWGILCLVFLIVTTVLHLLGLISAFHAVLMQRYKSYAFALRLLLVGMFPIVALVANAKVPLPFNMQTPWTYTLVGIFSFSILLPSTRLTTWVRWMMLPFTLYFFLLFLPVLPFIVLTILVCGAGLLFFIPIFVFWQHLQSLVDVKLPKWSILLALLVLPIGFLVITERDRLMARTLIEHLSTPDYTSGRDTLPFSEDQARATAHAIYCYEYGDRMPFLSRWRDFRLFDGLHPKQETMDALIARFGRPTVIGLFRDRPARPIITRRAPERSDGQVTFTLTPKDERTLTVHLTIPADPGKEFRSPVNLAWGVWVTGLRLQLSDGTWKDGTLRDRRTATWMYKDIVEQRLDPALLTLDSPTRGNLRVFPLDTDRYVEIDLLMPQAHWTSQPFELNDSPRELPLTAPGEDPRKEASVCFVQVGTTTPIPDHYDFYVRCGREISIHTTPPELISSECEDFDVKRAVRFAKGYAYANNLRIVQAHRLVTKEHPFKDAPFMDPLRPALPKLSPDDPWQLGAQMWQLAEAMVHNQTLDYRKEIREFAETCGVLTPTNAYIVVETEQQERQLAASDLGVKHAHLAFGVEQTEEGNVVHQDAPGTLLLVGLFGFILALSRKLFRKHKPSHPSTVTLHG